MARQDFIHLVSLFILLTATLCNCTANLHNYKEEIQENTANLHNCKQEIQENVVDPRIPTDGFVAGLVRPDQEISKAEQLRRGIEQSQRRLHNFQTLKDVDTPVYAGNGGFLMKMAIGTPAITYSAIVDTGSDLIWTQCKPCSKCFHQPDQIFDPSKSKTYSKVPCSSPFCEALPTPSCEQNCDYIYEYADKSFTSGVLSYETFIFSSTDGSNSSFARLAFGCGHDNQGEGFEQGSGVVGMGRGPLSLISQMGKLANYKFSYCLVSIEDPPSKTSPLLFGNAAEFDGPGVKSTPFVQSKDESTFYYLNLEGISVGGFPLEIPAGIFKLQPDGSGGIMIDSGTTVTFLEEAAYNSLKMAVEGFVSLEKADGSEMGLDLCYKLPSSSFRLLVPDITFHFAGGADFELSPNNSFVADQEIGLLCLAFAKSQGLSIFGNIQQQNFHILYDLAQNNLRFVPTTCDELR